MFHALLCGIYLNSLERCTAWAGLFLWAILEEVEGMKRLGHKRVSISHLTYKNIKVNAKTPVTVVGLVRMKRLPRKQEKKKEILEHFFLFSEI